MNDQPALSIRSLTFGYGESPVLRELSLDIAAGQVTAILGPNGSGKTTLLRLLLGVLPPRQGTVLLAGRPRQSYSRREQSQLIGLVPQSEHVPFDFSVLEFVLLGRAPYLGPLELPGTRDRQMAQEALEMVGVGDLAGRPVPNLSGGERQLVTIARTLAQDPKILLLDEPTAHLDLSNQGHLLAILRTLVTQGVTLVLTTHDPNLAAAVAGVTVLMRQGQVLQTGPTAAVLTANALTATYGVAVRVYQVDGRCLITLQ